MSKSSKKLTDKHLGSDKITRSGDGIKHKDIYTDYWYCMSLAPKSDQNTHWFQMLIIAFFTSAIILITRMKVYERPMDQFFWSGGSNSLTDFFSYFKMTAIIACAVFALVLLLYRVFTQSFFIKRSFAYVPMLIYSVLVLLSYLFSDYQEFALWGWNDRFEGTTTLLSYMVMIFFIINSVNSERNVKWIVYPLVITSTLLSLLGLTQALDHDFFRTAIGKKLITPSWFWDQIDSLNFTFQNKEIYQTVYNINYVSFYLTLLIPLFAMIFIKTVMAGKKEVLWKKIAWGALFALLIFNLIGSASSGGLMGMAIVVLIAIIVLNKKIVEWKKPIFALLIITVLISGSTYARWMPELTSAVEGVLGIQNKQNNTEEQVATDGVTIKQEVDYIETTDQTITISYGGNEVTLITDPANPAALKIKDSSGKSLPLVTTDKEAVYRVNDKRYATLTVRPAIDESKNKYLVVGTGERDWPFQLTESGPKYFTGMGKLTDLHKVPAFGWENNQSFGSGRGFIWSRTIPMMKDTILLGHGADTYCIYFPQNDYVGKYNSGTFSSNIDIIVDKPHNMYFGAAIGTGILSVLALLVLWGIYVVQSCFLYFRSKFDSYIEYVGAGIFFGICGFLVAGLVNDSSVSVMPMFYGLLATGISINMMLKRKNKLTADADQE